MHLRLISGLVVLATLVASPAIAENGIGQIKLGVPNANPKSGTQPTRIDPDFTLRLIATRDDPFENPTGPFTFFGQLSTGTLTEPDENTYLVLDQSPTGPTPRFDYGRHFLYQGHENGSPLAYVTRINLDVPRGSPNRITLLTPGDPVTNQTGFGSIDGSTFNPFTFKLLFTQEAGASGGVFEEARAPSSLDAFLGKAGYEGIHPDSEGNIYIIEDTGGATSHTPAINNGRQPNSFVYRYVPNNPSRIRDSGRLEALQVIIDGRPLVFGGAAAVDADISSTALLKLHTLGTSYPIRWVTIHTANAGDTAGFDANAAARPLVQHRSSGQRIWLGCQVQISRRFSLTQPATPMPSPARMPFCKRAARMGRFSASAFVKSVVTRAPYRCSSSAITSITPSTISRLLTSTNCSQPRIAATRCIPNSTRWTARGRSRSKLRTSRPSASLPLAEMQLQSHMARTMNQRGCSCRMEALTPSTCSARQNHLSTLVAFSPSSPGQQSL